MTDDAMHRRLDDREKELNARLDHLEKQHDRVSAQVVALDNSINVVKLEQSHMRELMAARLNVIEKASELHTAKLDDVRAMLSEAEKTPAGKAMLAAIREVDGDGKEHAKRLDDIDTWVNKADGAISTLRWMVGGGLAGLVGLGVLLLKLAAAQ